MSTTTNVYEGTVTSSRAYTQGYVSTWRVDYEIAGPGGDYIFTQYSDQFRAQVPAGQRVRFSWWSLAAGAAGTVEAL